MPRKPPTTVFTTTIAGWPIKVVQTSKGRFTVVYGFEVHAHLTYREAASQLGFSIFHALSLEGKLD